MFVTFDQRWLGLAALALNLLVGFEADTLRRWALERRGWRTSAPSPGKTAAECERRFFDAWLPCPADHRADARRRRRRRPPAGR